MTDNRYIVETSRRDVSNHMSIQKNAAPNKNHGSSVGHFPSQNLGTLIANSNVNETFPRNVSTGPSSSDNPTLFRDRYRIQSTRLPGWDYTSAAYYFVTICTFNREPTLADIIEGSVLLSPAGRIADEEWRNTATVRPNVIVGEYIVMPNHIHGILAIQRHANPNVETSRRDVSNDTSSKNIPAPKWNDALKGRRPRLQSGSLGAIIGQFKSVCTSASVNPASTIFLGRRGSTITSSATTNR